jgi:PilZ domain
MLTTETQQMEKRLNRRAKVSRMLRVRPSDPEVEHFEERPLSVNISKQGIYFHTHRSDYNQGMRLFITFPFTSAQDPMKCEYLAEVVRVEQLVNGRAGVAVRLLMTV